MKAYILISLLFMCSASLFGITPEERDVFVNSSFYILPSHIKAIERNALEGIHSDAYKLGRFYQYCLGGEKDEKNAAIWYSIAARLGNMAASNKLYELVGKYSGNRNEDYPEDKVFLLFVNQMPSLEEKDDVVSNYILYHIYRQRKEIGGSDRYERWLLGKISPLLLETWSEHIQRFPARYTTTTQIEPDDVSVYKTVALMGNPKYAIDVFLYYNSMNRHIIYRLYMMKFWQQISIILEGENSSFKSLFETLKQITEKELASLPFNEDTEKYLFLFYYFSAIKDIERANEYFECLKNTNIDKRLYDFGV